MAFVRISQRLNAQGNRIRDYYFVEFYRRGDIVRQKVLEYLGRDPDPKRLKRALEYWGVKDKKSR